MSGLVEVIYIAPNAIFPEREVNTCIDSGHCFPLQIRITTMVNSSVIKAIVSLSLESRINRVELLVTCLSITHTQFQGIKDPVVLHEIFVGYIPGTCH